MMGGLGPLIKTGTWNIPEHPGISWKKKIYNVYEKNHDAKLNKEIGKKVN